MNDDSKRIHDIDQAIASARFLGAALAKMLEGLVDEGTPRDEAVKIVAAYARGMSENNHSGER